MSTAALAVEGTDREARARSRSSDAAARSTPAAQPGSQLARRTCACGGVAGADGGECAACRARWLYLQRRSLGSSRLAVAPSIVHKVLRSPGRPLDSGTRAFFEPRFGHDFGHVRVHTDARAAESARAVDAHAYTVGRDVVFGAGRYAPATSDGRQLLAHELAHVVQGDATTGSPARPDSPVDALEDEANRVDAAVRLGTALPPVGGAARALAFPLRSGPGSRGGNAPAARPAPVPAVIEKYEESRLPDGLVRVHIEGKVGDPLPDGPSVRSKYPGPSKVGLPGDDRYHLFGRSLGADDGIVYAPESFNEGPTKIVESRVAQARAYVKAHGGDVFFEVTADCRVRGDVEGVRILELETITWKADVRAAGSNTLVPIPGANQTAAVPTSTPAPAPASGPAPPPVGPSGGSSPAPAGGAAPADSTPATTAEPAPSVAAGEEPPVVSARDVVVEMNETNASIQRITTLTQAVQAGLAVWSAWGMLEQVAAAFKMASSTAASGSPYPDAIRQAQHVADQAKQFDDYYSALNLRLYARLTPMWDSWSDLQSVQGNYLFVEARLYDAYVAVKDAQDDVDKQIDDLADGLEEREKMLANPFSYTTSLIPAEVILFVDAGQKMRVSLLSAKEHYRGAEKALFFQEKMVEAAYKTLEIRIRELGATGLPFSEMSDDEVRTAPLDRFRVYWKASTAL